MLRGALTAYLSGIATADKFKKAAASPCKAVMLPFCVFFTLVRRYLLNMLMLSNHILVAILNLAKKTYHHYFRYKRM